MGIHDLMDQKEVKKRKQAYDLMDKKTVERILKEKELRKSK